MHCSKCGKKNFKDAKFCYNCGNVLNIKINSTKNFFMEIANNYMINSKNKYYNIFILLVIMAVSSVFAVYLYKSFFSSFYNAMELINVQGDFVNRAVLRHKTELVFRDVWCIIILMGIFISLLISCFIVLIDVALIKMKIKYKKRKS